MMVSIRAVGWINVAALIGFLPSCILSFDYDVSVENDVDLLRKTMHEYLMRQMNDQYGWDYGNTPRAVIALALMNDTYFTCGSLKSALIEKQLQLELAGQLLKQISLTSGQLSLYVSALTAICENPYNFYGINLVEQMSNVATISGYEIALKSLANCIVGQKYTQKEFKALSNLLTNKSDTLQVGLDTQAMAVMALACAKQQNKNSYVQPLLKLAVQKFKKLIKKDGSFGNLYTTALIAQALISYGDYDKDWNFDSAVNYIISQYEDTALQSSVLSHYFVSPLLNHKSFVNLKERNCTCITVMEAVSETPTSNDIWDITSGSSSNGYNVSSSEVTKTTKDSTIHIASTDLENIPHQILNTIEESTDSSIRDDPEENDIHSNGTSYSNAVTYSLQHSSTKHLWNGRLTTVVFIAKGDTFLDVMSEAARTDDRFQFSARNTSAGLFIESIGEVKSDTTNKSYWLLYKLDKDDTNMKLVQKGVSEIKPEDRDHYVFWFRKFT